MLSIASSALLASALRTGISGSAERDAVPRAGLLKPSSSPAPVLWIFVSLYFAYSATAPLFLKIEPYFALHTIRSAFWGGAIIIAVALGMLGSQPVWLTVVRWRSHRVALNVGLIVVATSAIIFTLSAKTSPMFATAAAFVFGCGHGGVSMLLWARFSDVVSSGMRGREGLWFGLFSGAAKLGLALGILALGLVLSRIDFRDADRDVLITWMGAAPLIGTGVCLSILLLRGMTGEKHLP